MIRFFIKPHPKRPAVAVDIDAAGVAYVTCGGRDWRFREGERGVLVELSSHLAGAAGRDEAMALCVDAFAEQWRRFLAESA